MTEKISLAVIFYGNQEQLSRKNYLKTVNLRTKKSLKLCTVIENSERVKMKK
ncbi:MAG: hypothetical protein HYV53_01585 [Parcubacteria group bacterium]|nr:hypothetical protein [Parcubacteria group bacterium]